MASLPKQVSEAVRRRNPALFGGGDDKCDAPVVAPPSKRCLAHSTATGISSQGGSAHSDETTRQFTIHTEPVAAPRMTKRDKWLKPRRPCVQRYFDYRDVLRKGIGDLPVVPDELHAVFHFSMPESWSKKRRQEMEGKPHRQKPDGDNCLKAIQDAMFLEDGGVWRGTFEKRWAVHGRVEIRMIWQRVKENS